MIFFCLVNYSFFCQKYLFKDWTNSASFFDEFFNIKQIVYHFHPENFVFEGWVHCTVHGLQLGNCDIWSVMNYSVNFKLNQYE